MPSTGRLRLILGGIVVRIPVVVVVVVLALECFVQLEVVGAERLGEIDSRFRVRGIFRFRERNVGYGYGWGIVGHVEIDTGSFVEETCFKGALVPFLARGFL